MCSLGLSWPMTYFGCIFYYSRLINNAYCISFICCQLLFLCTEVAVVESSEFTSQSASESRLAAVELSIFSVNKGHSNKALGASGFFPSAVIQLRGFYAVLGQTSDFEGFAKRVSTQRCY